MNTPLESQISPIQRTSEREQLYILKGEGGATQYERILNSLSTLSRWGHFAQQSISEIVDYPIDTHMGALKKLGAKLRLRITAESDAESSSTLHSAELTLKLPTIGSDPDSFTQAFECAKDTLWVWKSDQDNHSLSMQKRYALGRSISDKQEYTYQIPLPGDFGTYSPKGKRNTCNKLLQTYSPGIIAAFTRDADLVRHWGAVVPNESLKEQLEQLTLQIWSDWAVGRDRNIFRLTAAKGTEIILERGKKPGEYKIEVESDDNEAIQSIATMLWLSAPLSRASLELIAEQTTKDAKMILSDLFYFSPRSFAQVMHAHLSRASASEGFEGFLASRYLSEEDENKKTKRKIHRLYGMYLPVIEQYYREQQKVRLASDTDTSADQSLVRQIYAKLQRIFAIFGEKIELHSFESLINTDSEVLAKMYEDLRSGYDSAHDEPYGAATLSILMRSFRIAHKQDPSLDLSKGISVFYPYVEEHLSHACMQLYSVISKQMTRDKQSFDQDNIQEKIEEFVGIYNCFHACFYFYQNQGMQQFLLKARENFQNEIKFDDPVIWSAYMDTLVHLSEDSLVADGEDKPGMIHQEKKNIFTQHASDITTKKEKYRRDMMGRKIVGSKSEVALQTLQLLSENPPEGIRIWKEHVQNHTFRVNLALFSQIFTTTEAGFSLGPLFSQILGLDMEEGGKSAAKNDKRIKSLLGIIANSGLYPDEKKNVMWEVLFAQYRELAGHVKTAGSLEAFLEYYPNDVFFIQALMLAAFDAINGTSGYLMNSVLKNLSSSYEQDPEWSSWLLKLLYFDRRAAADTETDWHRYNLLLHKFDPIHQVFPQVDRKIYVLSEDRRHLNGFYLKNIALEIIRQLFSGTRIDLVVPLSESVFLKKIENEKEDKNDFVRIQYVAYLRAFCEYQKIFSESQFIDQKTKKILETPNHQELRRFLKFAYYCSDHATKLWYNQKWPIDETADAIVHEIDAWGKGGDDKTNSWWKIFGEDLFPNMRFIAPSTKSFARTLEKLIFKYAGNTSELGDKFRATITVPDFSSVSSVLTSLEKYYHEKYGDEIDSISIEDDTQNPLAKLMPNGSKDPNPAGFRNATLSIGLKNGHMIEVQVVPELYYKIKTEGADLSDQKAYGFILERIKSHELQLDRANIDELARFIPLDGAAWVERQDTLHAGFLPLCDSSGAHVLVDLLEQNSRPTQSSEPFATDNLYHLHRNKSLSSPLRNKLQSIEKMLYEAVHGKIFVSELRQLPTKQENT